MKRNLLARVLPDLFAGVLSGTLVVTFGVTLAALIFTGDLAGDLPAGIGVVLAGSCVLGAASALLSSYRPIIAAPQENTSVILALLAAAVARRVASPAGALPTVLAALALASIATGALFLALGLLRLGKIVRFIPYPVVGGFLAATGWLLARGSISVMTGVALSARTLPDLLAPPVLVNWLPGACFGAALTVLLRRFRHVALLPALLAGGVALFYLLLALAGVSLVEAGARGWLLGPFPVGALWPPLAASGLARVEWSVLGDSAGNLAAVSLLAAMSILLNATGLELATEQELDLDCELRAAGIANLASGLLGGVVGHLSLSESALNHKVGARSRLPGLLSAALTGVTLLAGAGAIAYFPRPVLGGLLLFLGLSFLLETVWDAAFRLPRGDYALVLLILLVAVMAGFLQGIGVGLLVSAALFAVSYARVDLVKNAISGDLLRSKARRTRGEEAILRREGGGSHVFQLQGYVFFGTAYALRERVEQRLLRREPRPVRFLVLDFRHVDGLDSSAVVSFTRIRRLAEAQGARLVLTDVPPDVLRQLRRGGCLPAAAAVVSPDLDRGLERCEEEILAGSPAELEETPGTPIGQRKAEAALAHRRLLVRLLGYLERVAVPAGAEIYRQGEVSRDLYLIESGELEAWLDLGDGRPKRLRAMGAGSVVGELGLYLSAPRSASVRATVPTTLYRLSTAALDRMTLEAPRLAAGFHRFVATLLAERMASSTSAAQIRFY
jgi:sulfate permease, SulP family